ncbi:MAG: oligosaccharide flippase family protein [Amnibacterium sp.]
MPDVDTAAAGTTARTVARGAAYNYLAQIFTVVVQLGYAAVTSRLLPDHDFGVYGAAFTSMLLVNLLAMAGLPQTVGRMVDLGASRLAGLLLYALLVGVVAAAGLAATADLWAALWGTPQSASVLRVLAITSFITPVMSLVTGLSYRLGRFRHLAVWTFLANVAGMIVGVVAVAVLRTPESLAVSTIVGQAGVTVVVLTAPASLFRGRPTLRGTLEDVGYSVRVMITGLLTYAACNVGRVTFSRVFGAAALGQWNRADALTTTPFWQLQSAMLQAIYPEFRHDRGDAERARRVWTDLVSIVAWGCIPLGAFAAVVAPIVVDLVLGPGWRHAAAFAPLLAHNGGMSVSK